LNNIFLYNPIELKNNFILQIDFPAVTICSPGRNDVNLAAGLGSLFFPFLKENPDFQGYDIPASDLSMDFLEVTDHFKPEVSQVNELKKPFYHIL
jgi:hypothetical protein